MILEAGVLTWLIDKGVQLTPWLIDRARRLERASFKVKSLEQLNRHLRGQTVVHGPYAHDPVLVEAARHPLPSPWLELAETKRQEIHGRSPNDPHGMVVDTVAWLDDPVRFSFRAVDFADVCALRTAASQSGAPRPRVLSANALVLCPQERLIMLHRRSGHSATYPRHLHTVGGGYWPPGIDGREGDAYNLRHTVMREVFEEARVNLDLDACPMLVLEEVETGFVQLLFVGCTITPGQRRSIQGNSEGHVVWLNFDDLPSRLSDAEEAWVPTGKAAVLAWLAMGAPGARMRPRFAGCKPLDLFKSALGGSAVQAR